MASEKFLSLTVDVRVRWWLIPACRLLAACACLGMSRRTFERALAGIVRFGTIVRPAR